MSTITPNLGLIKPDTDDFYSVSDFNSNSDAIDAFANETITTDKVINNLAATEEGYALDARQGKILGDAVNSLTESVNENTTQLSESMNILIPTTGSTTNSIVLDIADLKNNQRYSFKANATSTGNVTINGKAFKKTDGTQIGSGGVKVNKVYDFYYDSSADCVFILAKAEGDSIVADVLAGKIFSNGDDTGLIGTMPNNGTVNQSLAINGTYTIPKGYHNGTGKVTQSVTTKAAATITPGTANQTIPANIYTTGVQTILGDPDLLAANIVSGKNIFGVVGTYDQLALVIGDNILYSDTGTVTTYAGSYTSVKSSTCHISGGTIRVKFDLYTVGSSPGTAYARVYINGVPRGTVRSTTNNATLTTYTEDFTVNVGDVVAIYAYTTNTGYMGTRIANFNICVNNVFPYFG